MGSHSGREYVCLFVCPPASLWIVPNRLKSHRINKLVGVIRIPYGLFTPATPVQIRLDTNYNIYISNDFSCLHSLKEIYRFLSTKRSQQI